MNEGQQTTTPEKKSVEKEFRQEREILNNFIELSPYAIHIIDKNGKSVIFNQAFFDLYKSAPPKDISLFDIPIIKEKGLADKFKEALEGKVVRIQEYWENPREYFPQLPDIDVCIKIILIPIKDKDNNVSHIVSMYEDITVRKKSENKLKESEEKYRDAYNRSELYKDILTHDINNILQNILTSTELSKLYSDDPEQREKSKEVSNLMNEQIIRGKILVSNVQKLSEVEEFISPIASVEALKILNTAIKLIKESYSYIVLNINVDSLQSQYFVSANELLINIFENILFNAVKHNKSQNIEILVRVSKDNKNGKNFIKFEFFDNGVGIPDQMKTEIFSRKLKEYNRDNVPSGIGSGLLLVNRILESYNGEIRVEDRISGNYSKGSNFIILIPEVG